MLKLKGSRLLLLAIGIATGVLLAPGAEAQQPRSYEPIMSQDSVTLVAAYTKKERKGRKLRGVWTCYQSPGERCCYNSVTGEEFCTGWPPR